MHINYYEIMLLIAVILTLFLVGRWRKRFDVNVALIFIFVDIANAGYMLYYRSRNLEEALLANKIVYLAGCYLPLLVVFLVIRLCRFSVNKKIKVAMAVISSIMYAGVLYTGIYPVYYSDVKFRLEDGAVILEKQYTPFHTCFNLLLLAYMLTGIAILFYTYYVRPDVSRKLLNLLVIPFLICIFGFWYGKHREGSIDLMPLLYDLSLVVYLIIIKKISMYDIIDTGIDALVEEGDTGFISLDKNLNYLGSNETARRVIPDISRVNTDTCIRDYRLFEDNLIKWLNEFTQSGPEGRGKDQFVCRDESGERYYYVNVSYLYDGGKTCGYQFFFVDNTKELKYNERLKEEVEEKTAHIIDMHNTLIMGMATMVESRDNSTGGHIKRTSELVRLLIDRMKKDTDCKYDISDEFCDAVIKAAPMHDLGKIAVDDDILRKPGRFEPWEFEKMKAHAPEGARIVHEILKGTDDETFKQIAENVAHFHHERWDGSGYPDGLKADEIPLEARIMAIADVYDALVSKRVYKERMSFGKADSIITEGMGTQFDKGLEQYYVAARPDFEAYYKAVDEAESSPDSYTPQAE